MDIEIRDLEPGQTVIVTCEGAIYEPLVTDEEEPDEPTEQQPFRVHATPTAQMNP